jgi:hypothetical protein
VRVKGRGVQEYLLRAPPRVGLLPRTFATPRSIYAGTYCVWRAGDGV